MFLNTPGSPEHAPIFGLLRCNSSQIWWWCYILKSWWIPELICSIWFVFPCIIYAPLSTSSSPKDLEVIRIIQRKKNSIENFKKLFFYSLYSLYIMYVKSQIYSTYWSNKSTGQCTLYSLGFHSKTQSLISKRETLCETGQNWLHLNLKLCLLLFRTSILSWLTSICCLTTYSHGKKKAYLLSTLSFYPTGEYFTIQGSINLKMTTWNKHHETFDTVSLCF